MDDEQVKCLLCGADDTSEVAEHEGRSMVECRRCGLVYQNPRPTREVLMGLYKTYHGRGGKRERDWLRLMAGNFDEASGILQRAFPATGSVLDVGCGYGHFLDIMKGRGWSAHGVEPTAGVAAHARRRGIDIREAAFEDVSFQACSYEAVTAFYVLEHLHDPLSALRKLHSALRPGGLIIARVPHTTPIVRTLASFGVRRNLYDLPYHLYDFSPRALAALFEKAGFVEVRITPGRPTVPPHPVEQFVSRFSNLLCRAVSGATSGRLLLPGTSKTAIAVKPHAA